MKNLFIFLTLLLPTTLFQQTLTQAANEPAVGDTEDLYAIDTTAFSSGLPIAITGSTAVWNFTGLEARNPQFSN